MGKISSTLDALLPLLETRHERDFLDHCLALKHESDEIRRKEERVGKDGLIHPQYLVSLLNRYADQDAIFFGDGGSPMVWVLRHIDVNGKRRTFTSLLHGTMATPCRRHLEPKKHSRTARSLHYVEMVA